MISGLELRDSYEVNAVKHRVYAVDLPGGTVTVTVAHSTLHALEGPPCQRRVWTCTIARRETVTLTDRDQRSICRRLLPHIAMNHSHQTLSNAPDGYTVTVLIEDPQGTI